MALISKFQEISVHPEWSPQLKKEGWGRLSDSNYKVHELLLTLLPRKRNLLILKWNLSDIAETVSLAHACAERGFPNMTSALRVRGKKMATPSYKA